MSLSTEYERQRKWRDWTDALDALPLLVGRTVLDLGCGLGDQTAELVARGARVIGVDMNDELLRTARAKHLANAEFRKEDLRALPDLGVVADGIWCSFAAAYFPDLVSVLLSWRKHVRPGGFIALADVDDLFGHEPLDTDVKTLFDAYAADALAAGRYDFHIGSKLRGQLEAAAFTVSNAFTQDDRELSFHGPADPEVLDGWRMRFERMKPLEKFCGTRFGYVRDEFLACLARADHRSRAKVYCCIGTR